jgi:hypothetical protein
LVRPRCAARISGKAAAAVLRCEGVGGGLRPELCASPRLSPSIACPLHRQTPSWFNRGPVPALTARNVAAKWECGLCVTYRLCACASQDAGSRHSGGCRKAESTAWMMSSLVSVPPSQRRARFLALPHSGWQTILELTCWVRGANPLTLEHERAWSH